MENNCDVQEASLILTFTLLSALETGFLYCKHCILFPEDLLSLIISHSFFQTARSCQKHTDKSDKIYFLALRDNECYHLAQTAFMFI
jgi:hypothetical protein